MNENKFCFITCVNNQDYYRESLEYINNLYIPEGYEVEVLSIEDSKSITGGYNQGMESSDAKYKIYLHQDTFIINNNFLLDILVHFKRDSSLGMIGMIGCKKVPVKGIWWESSSTIGEVYESSSDYCKLLRLNNIEGRYEEAEGIDGFIMITQYDLPWREDIFNGWHFYDLSQVMEFKRNGYKTIVPNQHEPWCVHDCGIVNTVNGYDKYRKKFIKEYSKDLFPLVSVLIPTYNRPKYLQLALESAINQTYCNIEIIIGDDSNNNHSEKLIKKYLAKYNNIRYYHNEMNLGQFENDLKLLDMAKGRYINFLMDDDLFELTKIEKMMEYFINDKEDQISLVTSNRKLIDEYGNFMTNYILDESMELVGDKIWNGKELTEMTLSQNKNIIGEPTTVLFDKNKLTEKFGYYKGRRCICNVNQGSWYNLLSNGKGAIIKEALSCFRQHNEQQLNEYKNIIGGVQDYTYTILNARVNRIFNDDIDYIKAIKNCCEYAKSIESKYLKDNELNICINKLNEKYEEIIGNIPLVSILIPTYNRAKYFEIALQSVLNQTYPKIEIIVGDDSTNKLTQELINPYLEEYKNIKYIYNEGPLGEYGYKNMENMYSEVSGEYVNMLMDDDIFSIDKIEKMMDYYFKYPNLSVVTSYRQPIDANGAKLNDISATAPLVEKDTIFNGKEIARLLITSGINFIGEPTTVLVKKKLIDGQYGTYQGKRYKGIIDLSQWLQCCLDGDVCYIREPLSFFRLHPGQNQRNINIKITCLEEQYILIKDTFKNKYFGLKKEEAIGAFLKWNNSARFYVENYGDVKGIEILKEQRAEFERNYYLKMCNICGKQIYNFLPYKDGKEAERVAPYEIIGSDIANFSCPICYCTDRTRHLFMYFEKMKLFNEIEGKNILHIAPELHLYTKVKQLKPNNYICGDLFPETAQIPSMKVDISDIQFKEEYFDIIFCNHVLEHVPDDLKAMSEFYRVLKKGGYAILQTPYSNKIIESFEDPKIDSDELRLEYYGQEDHVRIYGLDFFERLKKVGFKLNLIKNDSLFSKKECESFGVNIRENLIMVRK